jgi:hypothetical protein
MNAESLNWANIEEVSKFEEKAVQQEGERSQIIDIDARNNSLRVTLNKPDLGLGLLTGSELTIIRRKLQRFQSILTAIKTKKELEERAQIEKQNREYSEQTAKRHVNVDKDVRFSYDSIEVTRRSQGTREIPLDATRLMTATSTEISIPCQSGKTKKFDLTKIPAQYWRMMEEHKLAPLYFTIENSGMLDRKGNLIPLWSNQHEYSAVVGQRQIGPTVLMLMVV